MQQSAEYYSRMPMRLARVVLLPLSVLLLGLDCAAQVPGDERWDVRFGLPGTDNTVVCAAIKGTDIYIGGAFSLAGANNINLIAKWDGTDWSGLGSGVEGATNSSAVYSIVFKGDELYAGGMGARSPTASPNGMGRIGRPCRSVLTVSP